MIESLETPENISHHDRIEGRIRSLIEMTDTLYDQHYLERALRTAHEALKLAEAGKYESLLTESLQRLGRINTRMTNYEAAMGNLERVYQRCLEAGDPLGQAISLHGLGYIKFGQGQYLKSLEYFSAGLTISHENALLCEELICLRGIGSVYSRLGDYKTSLDYYLKGLNVFESTPALSADLRLVREHSNILINLGDQLLRLERWTESLDYSQRAMELARRINNRQAEIVALENLSAAYLRLEQPALALPLLEQGLDLSRRFQDRRLQIRMLSFLAQARAAVGELTPARECFQTGLQLAASIDSSEEALLVQTSYAEFLLQGNEPAAALRLLEQAKLCSVELGLQHELCRVSALLVTAHEQLCCYQEALTNFKEYHKLKQVLGGESHFHRIEAMQFQHEIEKTRQIAEIQRELNAELQRANDDLAAVARENQQLLEQVQHQAKHDSLTGLANRGLFEDRLQESIFRAERHNFTFAVMFIDLDGFKAVNDTLGHHAGDEVLISVADRLKSILRKSDTVARFGGDEFTVIVDNLNDHEDAALIARKLIKSLELPFEILGEKVFIGASIGISLFPQDGGDAKLLQKHADQAMYYVKQHGKRDICFYTAGLSQGSQLKCSIPEINYLNKKVN